MKKIISLLVAIIFICSILTLIACNCEHEWKKISNTATCGNNGIITYKCTKCTAEKQEESLSTSHDWKEKSNTATCTESGIKTSVCSKCNQEKTEPVDALGHFFDSDGICKKCGIFKFNIKINVSLPKTFSSINGYTSTIYSKCKIKSISFSISGYKLYINFQGEKTYDWKGSFNNETVSFTCILKDSNNYIISSRTTLIRDIIVGQQFKDYDYIASTSVLSTSETYLLEIVDRIY